MRGLLLILILISSWMFAFEPNMLKVVTYSYNLENLSGKKAVLAGDFHFKNKKRIAKVVEKINEQNPDYVFYIGDYTDKVPADYVVKALSSVKGEIYSVLGNHDDEFEFKNMPNLLNNRHITKNGITIAGIDYYNPDISKAIGNSEQPIILLSHNPDVINKVPEQVNLILSGHTHGGQVTLFGKPFVTPSKYRFGKGLIKNRMIITGGVGTSIIPMRLFNPPEINVIEFK